MTDDRSKALLLQGRGCNSERRPCGKCLRAVVKTENIYLSLRLPGNKKKEVRGKRKMRLKKRRWQSEKMRRGRRWKEGREVHLGKLLVIFLTSTSHQLCTRLPSTTCFLFVPVDLASPRHCCGTLPLSSFLSFHLISTSSSSFSFCESLLSHLSCFFYNYCYLSSPFQARETNT